MKCVSYAIADNFDIDELTKLLRHKGFEPKIYDDVIHISPDEYTDYSQDIFFFSYGCIVTWAVSDEYMSSLLEDMDNIIINRYDTIFDEATYFEIAEDGRTHILEEEDKIVLGEDDELIKLSCSYALSQSIKLEVFELKVSKTIENTRPICNRLAHQGKISLSRKSLARLIGSLFAERNNINLDNDILDTPEFFWRRPKYENFYHMAANYMDINTRLDILNRRLDAIHELYDILSNELNHIHSSRLEMTIILLIVIEVIMTLLRDVFKWL